MKRILFTMFAVAGLFFASQAYAMDLGQARSSGIIGERLDGYVAVVKSSSDAQALATEVNSRRRAEYEKISKQNGQPLNVVATLAAQQIIEGLPAGAMYQSPNGGWATK